jgi:hypothetical protein
VRNHVSGNGIDLLERYRIFGFWGAIVFDEKHRGTGADGYLADETIVRIFVARDPAAARKV